MKRLLAALAVLSLLALPAWAGREECDAAALGGDFPAVYRECLPLAQSGDAKAQNNLAFMYEKGQGGSQNYGEALKWYRKAAEQGDDFAQYHLGLMYEAGHGAAQDYTQAYMWYSLAIANSEGMMQDLVALQREAVAGRMTPDQIARAQEMARNFKPR